MTSQLKTLHQSDCHQRYLQEVQTENERLMLSKVYSSRVEWSRVEWSRVEGGVDEGGVGGVEWILTKY